MRITATQFQLAVNEYFTKLSQGEEIIITRYGRPFAVLVPYEEAAKKESSAAQPVPIELESLDETSEDEQFSKNDLVKIVKLLIKYPD